MKKLLLSLVLIVSLVCLPACSSGVSQTEYDKAVADKESVEKDLAKQQKEYDALKKEYDAYKKKMKPYEEMTEAQAEAEKAKAEEEKRKLDEEEAARKAAEEEAEQKAAEEEAAKKAEEEAKGYETGITYDQLARTPDEYMGKKVKFYGRVVQVIEGDDSIQIRFAVNDDYDMVLLGEYDPSIVSSRVLEDDRITIYGTSAGLITYESTTSGKITIPAVLIEKIDQ